jgi:PhnB protein
MSVTSIRPYLFFGGRCEEALAFYAQTLGANILFQMRFAENPGGISDGMLESGFENKVMHATFRIGEAEINASDGTSTGSNFQSLGLLTEYCDAESATTAFENLAEEGSVDMPLGPTFWSPLFGMVTDKFGVSWMITLPATDGPDAS